MMTGMKKFTDFTNHWKGREEETTKWFKQMDTVDTVKFLDELPEIRWVSVPHSAGTEHRNTVTLPRPPENNRKRRISFLRDRQEVELMALYFFSDPKADTAAIGNRCFDLALEQMEAEA